MFLVLAEDPDPLVGPLRLQAPQQQRPAALLHVQTGVEDTAIKISKISFEKFHKIHRPWTKSFLKQIRNRLMILRSRKKVHISIYFAQKSKDAKYSGA